MFNEIEHYRQHANDKQEKTFPEQQTDEAVIEKSPLYEEQAVKYQLTNRQIFSVWHHGSKCVYGDFRCVIDNRTVYVKRVGR